MPDSKSEFNRRKFLAVSLSGAVTAGLASLSPGISAAQEASKTADNSENKIISRQLGKTGMKIPIISMGVGAAGSPAIIQSSYELGVRHFDTAANYQFGRNEQMVGNVISKMGVRDDVIIGTKILVPEQRRGLNAAQLKEKALTLLDGSLKRLKTDYVDILYVHSLSSAEEVSDPAVVEAMIHLKELKKVRAIGISTHSNMAEIINETAKTDNYDVILTSINFTMADDQALLGAIKNAASKGIGFVAMKTLAGGGRWPNPESRKDYSGSTVASAALKWVLNNKDITTSIPGFSNYDHMREDFSVASNLEYTTEEKKLLSDNNIKLSMGFCRQCGQCLVSCPVDTDIPTLMRTHMYAAQYGDFYLARSTLAEIPKGNSLQQCLSCQTCKAQCANSVDIAQRIDELKVIFA